MKSLIFADVHANLSSLEAVLEHEGTWDDCLFLGDAVVGGPQPDEVLSLLATLEGVFIMGNHDQEVADLEKKPEARSQQPEGPDRLWIRWTGEQISEANFAFLRSFGPSCRLERQGWTFRLVHGVLPKEWGRRIWPDSPDEVFEGLAREYDEPTILIAHSHVQFEKRHGGRTIINPGSVGQPRLGRPLASYLRLQDGRLSFEAVPYDFEKTCRAMDRVPLERDFVESWKTCYRTGVLPARYNLRDFAPLVRMGYR